ncbi:UDP-2,4-diacetamido-2,4,6-trideoxy-beta-L-altropyranose hydrolase [Psychrobacter glaciei]|uniref:UDP-2,4-diacetamido-2,4, 6-trideoxy-beta-L-altropyranose hydrolase n=1 Tax=Psychrobacter glaciei TaxID=619771 RepID=UPI001F050851|nr:UDP-2,4-diacetamido-2,4,6-trideoxy-beta-L-altropyranose hydrolase [Psychrobacter glaciei]MCH1782996.1 UDP-2,4-diacetamido-2,4,6-trideoxy-beta-L-altropyranose hydrolase [Psychrobacter glaciei]
MRVVGFRVDAASHIGTGHLQRCLTLARKFDELGWRCIFFSRDYGDGILFTMNKGGFECHVIGKSVVEMSESNHFQWLGVSQEQDAIDTIKAINYQQLDIMIVDHYSIDYRWQQSIQENSDILIMVIDDLANRVHCCTLLIDQNFWPNSSSRYEELVPSYCKNLLGPNFTMLRKDFLSLRSFTRKKPQVETILVNFGGIGNMEVWKKFLPALVKCRKYYFHIITGKLSPEDFQCCKSMTVNSPHIVLEVETSQMSHLMEISDFALGACGSTVWERFCLGLNSALIDVAENQKDLVNYLYTQNLIDYLGSLNSLTVDSIFDYLSNLSIDSLKYQDRRKKIMQLVDGMGASRVANEIISIYEERCL